MSPTQSGKYDRLRRSQLVIAIHAIEQQLPALKYGSEKDRRLRAERSELFEALQKRDAEIIERWRASGYPAIS